MHLPRLHAKVYCADGQRAVVSSGNLTAGGLVANFECGLLLTDATVVARIETEMLAYAALGAEIDDSTLKTYAAAAIEARTEFKKNTETASRLASHRLAEALREAEDSLLRARLVGGAMHTVFARTIDYLLAKHGPLATVTLHTMVQAVHPDLCDDTIDRVINGEHFGKKWKHAVRTAQQQLKNDGAITLLDGLWRKSPVPDMT